MNRPAVRDAALLVLRIVCGVIFIAHGIDKLVFSGMDETIGQFSAWGIYRPDIAGWVVAVGELGAGAMLVIGLLTTLAAALLVVLMAAAIYFVNAGNGFYAVDNGVEFPAIMIAALVMIVVFGAGRASLDEVLHRVES